MAEPEESIPSVLLPCNSCGRTFRPDALSKHAKYCEKSLIKKRKVFDSAKQRLQGDLAEFLPVLATQKKKIDKSPIRKTQSKWKEKHLEFVRAIRAAKGGPASSEGGGGGGGAAPAPPVKPVDHEKCLYCDRYFGPKAYDRHLEWCKEHSSLVRPKSPASIQAKQRLEARTKYKAPLLNRTRRASISEKCSPKSCTRDPSPAAERLTRTRSSSLSSRTVTNMNREPLSNVSSKTNSGMDSFRRNQPARNSRRSVSPLKKTTPETAKNKAVNNNLNQNNRTRGRQVASHVVKNEAKREEKTTPKSVKDDLFSASCNISPITPGQNQKQKQRTPSHNSGSKYNTNSQSKGEQCMLNTILISQDVMGMTVQQCCLKSDTETDELAEKYYKVGEESKYLKCSKARQISSRKSPSIRHGKIQQFKPDLLISNDIVHFTGIDDEVSKQNQIVIPPTDCNNFTPDVHESDSSIEILHRTKDVGYDPRILAANEIRDHNLIVPVGQCSNNGDDDNTDDKLGTYGSNEVGVSSIDRELLKSDLHINSSKFRDDGKASQYSENSDEFDVGQNSFFTEECISPEMVPRSLEKEAVSPLEKEGEEVEGDAMLSTKNNPKVSLEMLFSNPKLDSKENLCSNCRKTKSESDVLLFYRKDMMKCCVKQRQRIFEVKKSLFQLLSNHILDALSRPIECQESLWEDGEPDYCKVGEYNHPSTDRSLTKYKSCSSIDEKSCSDKGSGIEVIDGSEGIEKSTCDLAEDEYNFQWRSTHEILSPKRKLSPVSVDLVEILKEKFCNPIFSDEGPRVEEVSSIQNDEDLVDYIGGCKNYTLDFPCENNSEVQYPSIEVHCESVDLIESPEQVRICDPTQDCSLENENSGDEFHKSSGEFLPQFVECQTVDSSSVEVPDKIENSQDCFHKSSEEFLPRYYVECEAIGPTTFEQLDMTTENSQDDFQKSMNTSGELLPDYVECESGLSATFELPDKVSTKEDEHLNTSITTDISVEENVGLIDDGFEINEENIEDDRLSYIIETDKTTKENDNVEESLVTRDSENHVNDVDVFSGNGSVDCEQQDESKGRLKARKKLRSIKCNKLKDVSILNSRHNPDYNEGSLDNVEPVDPQVDDDWADKLQTTNKKRLLRRNFKTKIPSRKVNKPPADVRPLKNKIQTPSKNKTVVELETWKSRFPVIGKSSSPTEMESIPNIELPSREETESDSCAVLYYNESVGRLWKINNFNSDSKSVEFANSRNKTSDSKGFEFATSRNKTFSLPPIKESSSVESSKSLSIKQSETKIESVEQNGAVESIETNILRRKHLPMIRRATSNEMNVENGRKIVRSMENYDPYKSAERQMKELLGLSDDDDAPLAHSLVPQPPSSAPLLSNSFNSAFAKFSPIHSYEQRSPDSDLDNDFERLEAESRVTPTSGGIVDKNFNPMSLSTISLCSTISIESFDNSRNNLRKGISSSAKEASYDRKASLPLQRSVSVVEAPRRGRDFLKSNLKMEHLLFGSNYTNNNNFNDNSLDDEDNKTLRLSNELLSKNSNSSLADKTLRSSNELLKNSNSSLADASRAEQELLKSVSEFEKLFATPASSLNPYSPLIPNSSPANSLAPLDHIDKHRSQANKFITDSAYNSLNRKSPQEGSPVDIDNCSSGSDCSSTRGKAAQTANFCHECGAKFPVLAAKFCCNCGVRRLII